MFTKRLLAGLLAVLLCFAFVSCNEQHDTETTESTTGSVSESESSSSSSESSSSESSSSSSESSSSTQKPEDPEKPVFPDFPELAVSDDDLEKVNVGKYVTLRYNASAATVSYEVKKGVGSRENITLTVTPKNGYTFDGWSAEDAIANGRAPVSTETTYSFTATYKTTVFLNSSATLNYHENGGTFGGGFNGKETYSVVFFQNPNTKISSGDITREGYTLVGYNTKEDGTGEYVSLGAKVTANGQGVIDLWCVWEENTPADQFTYTEAGGGITIQKYNGTAETVVIPEKINGKTVLRIASGAFDGNNTLKKIVIAKTVRTVDAAAFRSCSALTTAILFDDSMSSMDDNCFNNCTALTTIHINTRYTLTNQWFSCGAAKFDRLMWAKDKKKIIIIGGSGSMYGYDCAVIDKALGGEYEIINLGENANIPSLMYFDVAEDFIGEGDIVLWCPEPGWYTMGAYAGRVSSRMWDFRKGDYGFTQYLTLDYYTGFFSGFANNCSTLAGYSFKNFDRLSANMSKYGDDLSPRLSQKNTYDYTFDYPMREEAAYSAIFTNIQDKGGKVFFSFAAMAEQNGNYYAQEAAAYEQVILSLPGVVSISDFDNCLYDYLEFSDSAWHMTDTGATLRSQHVAMDLRKALGMDQ